MMRVPRMHTLPWQICGFVTILSCQFMITLWPKTAEQSIAPACVASGASSWSSASGADSPAAHAKLNPRREREIYVRFLGTSTIYPLMGGGTGSPRFLRLARYPIMASLTLASALARVLPCKMQPGSAGALRHEHAILIQLYHHPIFHAARRSFRGIYHREASGPFNLPIFIRARSD
jgi:hypothetical protein